MRQSLKFGMTDSQGKDRLTKLRNHRWGQRERPNEQAKDMAPCRDGPFPRTVQDTPRAINTP